MVCSVLHARRAADPRTVARRTHPEAAEYWRCSSTRQSRRWSRNHRCKQRDSLPKLTAGYLTAIGAGLRGTGSNGTIRVGRPVGVLPCSVPWKSFRIRLEYRQSIIRRNLRGYDETRRRHSMRLPYVAVERSIRLPQCRDLTFSVGIRNARNTLNVSRAGRRRGCAASVTHRRYR